MAFTPTLTQYLLGQLAAHPDRKDLVLIMSDLATIGKIISRETNRAGLASILGAAGSTNIQDEEVQKLDVFANELCKNYLRTTGHFCAMASEEEDTVVDLGGEGKGGGKYVIAFDPLDGSSNIDVNVSIGTIFSVHRRLPDLPTAAPEHFLQPGKEQVLAGYILYGSSTVLVFSFGNGVHEFTLDQSLGEFFLSRDRMQVPKKCKYYSVNEANFKYFQPRDQKFVTYLRDELGCGARYIGSFAADFHRNLITGGIFLYPGVDKKGTGEYKPKLRLNFEAKPMAFLLAHAGGLAMADSDEILAIKPVDVHQRVPIVMGNKEVMREYAT